MKNNTGIGIKYILIYFLYFSIFLFIFFFIFNIFLHNKKKKIVEPFQWSQNTIKDFLTFQTTVNPLSHFNIPVIEKQASEEEVKYLLQRGYWPWSEWTDNIYMNAIATEPIIRINPEFSLHAAKKIYNENAIKKMLAWNTKEGEFLLNGGFVYIKNHNDQNINRSTIKCFSDVDGHSTLKKIQIDGYNWWNGYKNEKITNIKNEDVEKEMPGFTFIKQPCNPCLALDNDYSCPFKLNVKGDDSVSDIWKNYWNI